MSVHEHKAEAPTSVQVQILVVSTSRKQSTDRSGVLIGELLQAAGHVVLGREVVKDDVGAIRKAVSRLVATGETQVVLITGGTGITALDVTPEAVEPLFDRRLPGFGELFRWLSFQEVGSAAMISRATAGVVGGVPIFAMPGSEAAVRLAVEKLVLPELGHLLRHVDRVAAPADVASDADAPPATTVAVDEDGVEEEVEILDEDGLPPPTGSLGALGMARREAVTEFTPEEEEVAPETGTVPYGWLRAVREISGEILREKREELPWELEKIAPVVNVLDTAGEQAVLVLPSGMKFSIWGWPDLQRPQAKVLAVGWGQPLAEVIALHRYPVLTGTCIEEERGLLPNHGASVEDTCREVTGRVPRDTSGSLFAVQGDAVYILRGNKVIGWDGRRETDQGLPKQALATLMISWANR